MSSSALTDCTRTLNGDSETCICTKNGECAKTTQPTFCNPLSSIDGGEKGCAAIEGSSVGSTTKFEVACCLPGSTPWSYS